MKIFILLMTCGFAFSGNGTLKNFRKHYGLSYYKCQDKIKTFQCLTACKSHGYQVFRIDGQCTCTCHQLKRDEVLPFFKWKTTLNVTRPFPKTQSVSLYHIIGSLSPEAEDVETTTTASTNDCPTMPAWYVPGMEPPKFGNDTSGGNDTMSGDNSTMSGGETGGDTTAAGAGGGDATGAEGDTTAAAEGGGEEAAAE